MVHEPNRDKLLLGGLVMLLFLGKGGLAGDLLPGDKTFDTTDSPHIRIVNEIGNVVVKGWDRPQVHVVCTGSTPLLQLDAHQLPLSGRAEKVHLTIERSPGQLNVKPQAADLTVEMPFDGSVEIENVQGSVLVKGVRGSVSIETVGGSVTIIETAEHSSVRSIGGDILAIRTSGPVEATSINGKLHFIYPTSHHIKGNTTSGDIVYEGDLAPGADYRLSSYSGNIEFLCPRTASFDLRAKSVRGKVIVDPRFILKRKGHPSAPTDEGNSFSAIHNTGSAALDLGSFSGTIHIQSQN
ncbi:MAG TPA: hypothetical protein VKV95_12135 [Terriglobia bacterium]|nr:hypothetical protein [Terriglobia bacterium]